jgi:glutamate--cysteine ligase
MLPTNCEPTIADSARAYRLHRVSMQGSLTRETLTSFFSAGAGSAELVGIEVENGLVDQTTGCSVPYDAAQALLQLVVREFSGRPLFDGADADGAFAIGVELPNGASFTLETGGALEYASKPSVGLVEAIHVARVDLQRVAAIAERIDIALLSGGCLPFTPQSRIPWIPKPRVKVMRDYFNQLGESGKYAEAVMGVTLSTQTSLDYLSGQDFMDKLRLHVLAAPIVAALFVNSPIAEGGYSGVLSRRMQYWRNFDPRRCGILSFALNANASVEDFIDWASQLPMIYRKVKDSHVAAPYRPFAGLMRNGFGDGTWPTHADWELHLCQIWPHVRPRRTLELRASDGLPWPYFSAAPAIWVGLTYDSTVRKEASDLLMELTPRQLECAVEDIAVKGLAASVGPHPVSDLAHELLRLARRGLQNRVAAHVDPPEVLSYLEPLEQVDEDRETFADKCLTLWQGQLGQSAEAYVEEYRVPSGR